MRTGQHQEQSARDNGAGRGPGGRGAASRRGNLREVTGICVSLVEASTGALIERMGTLEPYADLFEIRGDQVAELDLAAVHRARTRPLLFTCRPGGRVSAERRRELLLQVVGQGVEYVDIEDDAGWPEINAAKSGRGLVVSHHDFESTPADLDGIYRRAKQQGADIVKIAVTPRSVADVGRLLALARGVRERSDVPLMAIGMGPLGIVTRVIGGRYGAPFTYACPDVDSAAGPGQIPAQTMAESYRVRDVGPGTQVYGVLGAAVTHSLSPAMHNAAFAAHGVDGVYVPLQANSLEAFMNALPNLDLAGFSVTRPYKAVIVPHLHEVEKQAARCGSVNTVTVTDGKLIGSTTDGAGVVLPLCARLDLAGQRILILGAGGAARSAAFALCAEQSHVTVCARRAEAAAAVASGVGCGHMAWASRSTGAWDILINATPLGSREEPDTSPLAAEHHRSGTIVFDMVYDPLETRLLREARAADCTTIDGLEMLAAQAAAQFHTWTAVKPSVELMRGAALGHVSAGAPKPSPTRAISGASVETLL